MQTNACIMTFTNKWKYLSFDDAILSQSLPRVTAVKDLGVTLTSNLNFKDHISHNVSKAFKRCGFIKCVCTTFTDVQALRSLYISLVRSQLEYCSVIWNPWQHTFIDKIERVKKKFIKYLCYKSKIQYSTDNYPVLCHHFRLSSLQHCRQVADLIFLYECVYSLI